MALMTEERRKEMEEEMSRFELEIATPGALKSSSSNDISGKPLSPPPPPPAVAALIPEVLVKAPPPPPPSSSPPIHAVLRPPPPPPLAPGQPRPQGAPIRFIPHQLQRQPLRPPMRPSFVPMRVPMGGPPAPFSAPASMAPFVPSMGQGPSVVGPQIPGASMPPMGHGPMGMAPMHMPPQMGGMNINLPMPPGFCPPTRPMPTMTPGAPVHCDQSYRPSERVQDFESANPTSTSSSESSSVVAAAPTIYAAPFVKSHGESTADTSVSSNGQEKISISTESVTTPKSEKSITTKAGDHTVGPNIPSANNEEAPVSKKKEKKKKIIRMAGGQAWEDNSLLEWDPDDFRIFCGDLGNDVTDEVLIRAFSKYASFVKAKVIRDKRTNKTKGFGFVSFKDPQDFIKAMREMNGKYVGSRPIKLRKSTWRDRNIELVKKKQREKEKLGLL